MKKIKTILALILAFAILDVFADDSAPFFLNTAKGTRIAKKRELISYSTEWDKGSSVRVTADGTTLKEAVAPASGDVAWDGAKASLGLHTLTHVSGGKTLTAQFTVLGDDVVVHSGVLKSSEIWDTNKVHLVTGAITVPSGVSLTISSGAVVKFMPRMSIAVISGGSCTASGVIFTHVNDDTIGGDTLMDEDSTVPKMGEYTITGNVIDNDATEYRYSPPQTLTSNISSDTRLRGYRTYIVSNSVTVASGAKLTLQPGTILKFNSGCSLTVNGTLDAKGTRAAPIVFTSLKDDEHGGDTNGDGDKTYPDAGDWDEIKNNGGVVNLAFASALYGGYGQYSNQGDAIIRTASGTTTMDCCVIMHSNLRLVGRTGGTVSAVNCILQDGRWGIDGAVTFINGVIADCNTGANGATVRNSILWECDTYASGGKISYCTLWGADGNRPQSIAFNETSGNIWGDPLFVDPDNGDFRISAGSPCVAAGDGSVAPETDYYGQPRNGAPEIGIYEVIGDSSTGYDLAASSVSSTGGSPVQGDGNAQAARSTIGDVLDISYVVTNVGRKAVYDPWHDALYLVSSSSGKQYALGELLNNGALGVNESRTSTVKFTIPVLPIGKYSIRLVVNSRRMDVPEGSVTENNTAVSESEIEIVADSIDASQGASGSVSAGSSAVCAFTVPSGTGHKLMRVTSMSGGESLFARCGLGFLPVAADSGTGLPFIGGAAYILVPAGIENVWVVLDNDGSSAASYEVEFIDGSMAIVQVSPSSIPSSGKVTVEIAGAGFTEDCEVSFTGASTVKPVSVKCVSQGKLAVTVDAGAFASGKTYSIAVRKGSETKTLQNALSVAAAPGKPKFWAKLDVPSSMRQGRLVETCFIEYGNSGTADMISPVLQVLMIGDGTLGYMGGQSGLKTLQFIAAGDKGSAGVLRPGSSHRIRFAIRAGASNKISLHTSDGSDYAPAPWTNAADYLADLSAAATRIGLAEQDATDYPRCMELAKSSSGLSCVSGRILDRTYGILPGLKVTLAGESNALDVYTDDKGRFFLDMVPSGTYDLILDGRITCKKDILISDRDLHFGDLEINADVDYVAYVDGVSPVEAGTMKLYGDDIMISPIISGDTALFYNVSNGVYTIEYSDGENIAMQTVVINDESLASCYLVPEKIILEKIQFPEDFDMGKDTYYYVVGNNGLYYEGVQPVGSRIIEKPFSVGKYWITIYDEEQLLSSYIVEVSDESVDYTVVDAKKEVLAAKSMALSREKLLNARGLSGNELINVRVENLCKDARALVQGLSIEEPLGDVFCTHSFAKMREDKLLLSDFKVRTAWLEYRLGITRGLYMKKHAKAIKAVFLGAADAIAEVFGLPVTGLNDLFAEMSGDQEFSGETAFLTVLGMTLDKPEDILDIVRHTGVPVSKKMSQKWLKTAPKLSTGLTLYGIIDRFSEIDDVSDEIDAAFAILATHADVFEQELSEFKRVKESFNQYFSCCNQIFPEQPYEYRIDTTTPSIPKSSDPNEMVGEDGVGDARYVKPGQELTYTIYFENKHGFDIADAQEVRVTNPLSKWLDWSTFEMREVAFNNQNDVALDGLANGTSEVRMNGTNKYVRTTVECDTKTGVVTWYMRVYDPNGDSEGYPVDGSGFLPSNDETHRGEGHLTYRIKLRNDASSNVVITNSATIVFDYNEPIETDPAWWNTVAKTVDVHCDGGLILDDLVVGLPIGELSDPELREGYEFEGWYTGKNGTGIRVTADTIVTADMISLYPHWTKSTPEPEPEPEPTPTPEPDSRIKWTIENGVLVEVELNGATVAVIPDEVTVIGSFAFSFCSTLKEVVIPNTVTEIGYCAFYSCSFTSVIIPESVTVINDSAFRDCRLLTSFIVPNNIIRIGDSAFEYCNSLRTVYIPKRLKGELSLFKIFALCPSDIKIIYYEGNSPEDDTNPEVIEGLTSSLGGVKLYGTVDGLPSAKSASVYDGYLYLNNVIMGTIQAKLSKPKVNKKSGVTTAKTSVTIQINGEKKVSLKDELDLDIGEFTATDKKSDRTLMLKFGLDGIYGTFGKYEIDGVRNFFSSKDKDEKSAAEEILKPYLGGYSMICDGGILSVTIAKKGKVTVKGTYNDAKVSAKTQALIGEEMICIPVIYSKKSVNVAFTIWLPINGGDAVIIGLDDAIIGKAGTLKNGAKFIIDGDIGDFIETEDPRTLELLPDNETITVSKSKWLVADGIKAAKVAYKKGEFTITEGKKGAGIVNPSGLKLTYKSKDGSFSGSFTAYAIVKGKLKKHKATVEGILIGDVGYGTITIKKVGTWAVTIK